MNSGDAAEQIVRMSLNGVEVAAKIAGQGTERLAKLLYAILKDQKRTKGKARLSVMLNNGKPIKVFAINDKDLNKFYREAKKYGVMYHVLKDRDKTDGKCDIMVRAEDASKVNRIFERFNLGVNNQAAINSVVVRSKPDKQTPEKDITQKGKDDRFLDELFAQPNQKEKSVTENPTMARTTKSSQSEPISKHSSATEKKASDRSGAQRPSVRKELNEIKAEQKSKSDSAPAKQKTNNHMDTPKRIIQRKEK